MRLNTEAWTELEIFNFFQILMIAKFSSDKTPLMIGQPMLYDLMKEILEGEMVSGRYAEWLSRFRNMPLDRFVKSKIVEMLGNVADNFPVDAVTMEQLAEFAYPYQVCEEDLEDIRKLVKE